MSEFDPSQKPQKIIPTGQTTQAPDKTDRELSEAEAAEVVGGTTTTGATWELGGKTWELTNVTWELNSTPIKR